MPARGPAYRIETERLVLRCWRPADAPLLLRAISESLQHLRAWMPWAHEEPEPLDAKIQRLRRFRGDFDLDRDFVYGIFDQEENEVLGGSGLHTRAGEGAREIGYWIHSEHLRRGFATEAASALTRVAFEIDGVHRVEIRCDPRNRASAGVPAKIGFRLEKILEHDSADAAGQSRDTMVWGMSEAEFRQSAAAESGLVAFDARGVEIPLSGMGGQPGPCVAP